MAYNAIAVFCGSKNGNNPLFVQHAGELGKLLAENNIKLIYGGGSIGLMGAVSGAVIKYGGLVTGVMPKLLIEREHQHNRLSELIVVDDMHARKKKLYELCDAAIILPGGFGTLDELFEMLTWNQLSIHNKPIFFINSAGFYDPLIRHMEGLEEHGFLYDKLHERITLLPDPAALHQFLL